jgi:hypothetical protein
MRRLFRSAQNLFLYLTVLDSPMRCGIGKSETEAAARMFLHRVHRVHIPLK